jgi:hypothetical protein
MTTQPVIRGAFAEKLRPVNAESWSAWRLGERESDALPLNAPNTLDEAVHQALTAIAFQPKDTLAVLYTHAGRNRRTLWLYAIKRSRKRGTLRAATDGGRKVFVGNLEPVLTLQTEVASFAPILRFDAFKDDPTGIDRSLVEIRS